MFILILDILPFCVFFFFNVRKKKSHNCACTGRVTTSLHRKDKPHKISSVLCLANPLCKAPTAVGRKAASFPAWALSAPTGCMLCQSKAGGWGAVRHEHWCHSHMDSGVVMLGGWEAELCWPAAAETAVQGFALVVVVLLWTRSLMMYFVISAMKGKSVCMLILHSE